MITIKTKVKYTLVFITNLHNKRGRDNFPLKTSLM